MFDRVFFCTCQAGWWSKRWKSRWAKGKVWCPSHIWSKQHKPFYQRWYVSLKSINQHSNHLGRNRGRNSDRTYMDPHYCRFHIWDLCMRHRKDFPHLADQVMRLQGMFRNIYSKRSIFYQEYHHNLSNSRHCLRMWHRDCCKAGTLCRHRRSLVGILVRIYCLTALGNYCFDHNQCSTLRCHSSLRKGGHK